MLMMSSPVILALALFGAVAAALFFLAVAVFAMFGSLFLSTLWSLLSIVLFLWTSLQLFSLLLVVSSTLVLS